ncbi:MAG TPA: hypothetical protein VJZ68_05065 [Nitrososphaera sp.]|nr:hypothetical protein [Nitrososphaera sp.]
MVITNFIETTESIHGVELKEVFFIFSFIYNPTSMFLKIRMYQLRQIPLAPFDYQTRDGQSALVINQADHKCDAVVAHSRAIDDKDQIKFKGDHQLV